MIRLILTALFFYLLYTLFHAVKRSLKAPPSRQGGERNPNVGAEMVADPACGTFVPRDQAVVARVRGERYYFCSEKCRDTFVRKGA